MLTATTILNKAKKPILGKLVLSFGDRYRRRIRLEMTNGEPVLLNFCEVTQLNHGAFLDCGVGSVEIEGAIEPVIEIWVDHGVKLAELAWHLGNRHLPVQILEPLGIRIAFDEVILKMLHTLGADPISTHSIFAPTGGAYGGGPTYGHKH